MSLLKIQLHAQVKIILLCGLIALISSSSFSQEKVLNVHDIINKHAEATGLSSRIKVNTLVSFGKINQLGEELDITILQKRPDKYRMDVHFAEARITQCFDGEKGWSLNPFISNDTISIEGNELEQLIESALFDGILFNAPDLGFSIEYLGEDDTNFMSHVLLLKKPNGDELKFFIDRTDFLVKKTEASLSVQGVTYKVNSIFSDFKKVEGMTLPFLIQNNNGQMTTKIKIEQVRVNEKIEDGLFTGKR